MEKQPNPVAKVFAILFAILFVISAIISILSINVMNQAFNPETYKHALSASVVYDRLPQLIGEQIVFSLNRNPCIQDPTTCTEEQIAATPAYLSSVEASAWAALISKLVEPDWVKQKIESAIDQIMITLTTPGQPLSLDISLVEFKAKLGGEDGYQAVISLINSLEPCQNNDMLSLLNAVLGLDDLASVPLCRPSESVLQLGEDSIRYALTNIADKLPDNTSSLFSMNSSNLGNSVSGIQRTIQFLDTVASVSLVIPLSLLLVITLLVVRSFKSFLKWWGIPFIIVAALCLLATLMITPLVHAVLLTRMNALGLAPGLLEMIKTVILQVAKSFTRGLYFQNGLLFLLGCLMVIAARLIRPQSRSIPE
jgi:hypothetical protein